MHYTIDLSPCTPEPDSIYTDIITLTDDTCVGYIGMGMVWG